jgi:hypothetical protein
VRRLGAVLLVSLAACAGPRIAAKRVVIVTFDTTRADYLSAYGSTHVSTPNVDALARRSAVFEKASTVAPLTLTAHSSLFTGLLPPHHGVRDNAADPLAAEHTTLAEVLQRRGFHTAAFVASAVLQASRGLARGFDVYRDGVSNDSLPRRFRRPGGAAGRCAVPAVDAPLRRTRALGPSGAVSIALSRGPLRRRGRLRGRTGRRAS